MNAVTTGAMQVIKIWLLVTILSTPSWPSVRTIAEVWFEEESCENRKIIVENEAVDMAMSRGYNPIFVDTACIETEMFIPFNS